MQRVKLHVLEAAQYAGVPRPELVSCRAMLSVSKVVWQLC